MLKSFSKLKRKVTRFCKRHRDGLQTIKDAVGCLLLFVMGYIITVLTFCL